MVDYMIHGDTGTQIESKTVWQGDTLHAIPNQEQGDILYVPDATHSPTYLHHGNAGDVLMSGGHGADPSWGRRIVDRLAGVTPTQSGWDTAPTDLDHSTDGDWDTVTGAAVQNALDQYSASSGYIQWDMGAIYNVQVRAKISVCSATAYQRVIVLLNASTDGSYYYVAGSYDSWLQNYAPEGTLLITFSEVAFARARYLRAYLLNYGSQANCSMAVYEIQAIDFGV